MFQRLFFRSCKADGTAAPLRRATMTQREAGAGYRPLTSRLVGCLALMALISCLLVPATTVAKKNGKGKDGGGKTNSRLGRIRFVDPSSRIQWDGQAACPDPSGEIWDYWDFGDPDLTVDPNCIGCVVNYSGGGRLHFFTASSFPRWLTLDFRPPFDADEVPFDLDDDQDGDGIPDGPNIDQKVYPGTFYPPEINTDTFVDNVKCTVNLGSMFKKNVTRQPLFLGIRSNPDDDGWPGSWSLHSTEDLYIIDDPDDKDLRTLTTFNPNGGPHSDLFELRHEGVTVGLYRIPLTWEMRIIPGP